MSSLLLYDYDDDYDDYIYDYKKYIYANLRNKYTT